VTIEDAEDGSGDGILTFPDGMCESLGWAEGDELSFEVDEGKSVIIRNTSKNPA
jgi:bifunctional DNA-binding transcriptional regulator/antitoxin component of YhaV-PrlF toxin-antitoxin module